MNSRKGKDYLRNRIFYVFQNYGLVDEKTIEYNLGIPLLYSRLSKTAKKECMREALTKVELELPLTKYIYQLSGGEQQRVAIARAFLRKFDSILADEPTGSLDAVNRDRIMKILEDFNHQGKTVIIVSHDENVISRIGRVIRL